MHPLVGCQLGSSSGLITGLRGDEPVSFGGVRRIFEGVETTPVRGIVAAVPRANPLALQSLTRSTFVDMVQLNDLFPGDRDGTFSRQLADAVCGVFDHRCDYVIDFRFGGIFPTVDYVFIQGDRAFARLLGSKVLYRGQPDAGSVSECLKRSGSKARVMGVGGGQIDGEPYICQALLGIRDSLCAMDTLGESSTRREDQSLVSEVAVLCPHHGGLLLSTVRTTEFGEIVPQGRELGLIVGVESLDELEVLKAPFPGSLLIPVKEGVLLIIIGEFACIFGRAPGQTLRA